MKLLSSWVSDKYLGDIENLKLQFNSNRPFQHIVLKDFLKKERVSDLLGALQKEKFIHKESDLFSLNQTHDLKSSKSNILRSFHLMAASKEFADFMCNLTGIKVKAGALDLAGSLYKSGDYLLCHDDQVEDRKIAYILYLSQDFKESDGGSFMLFDEKNGEPNRLVQKHLPLFNHLMIFQVSRVSFHAVEENMSNKERYAIGGWLH